ncbi:MAG: metallophosphoesterase [Tannerella sp.]|jgi:hypothetical protein|nr:metallophosphoesterase [Tannerella sp.]
MMISPKYLLFFFLFFPFFSLLNAQEKDSVAAERRLADGPYIFYPPGGGMRVLSVDTAGNLNDTLYGQAPPDFSFRVVSRSGKRRFDVKLHPVSRPDWKCRQPEKLLVLSDPHGDLDCFISVLHGNNVINGNCEWIFGKNHLMVNGDVFDRGQDVLPLFWLIYKLEQEAEEAGGKVSFLLGNHEAMVLSGDLRYTDKLYRDLSERLGMNCEDFFSASTELGRWLGTRNTVTVIGDDLFVHAGLGEDFLNENLSLPLVNEEMSKALFMTKQQRNDRSEPTKFLYGNQGPVWYRGMVRNDEKYNPLHIDILDRLLKKYQAKRIIVGHTVFPDITAFYGGKVIAINVDNKENFEKVLGRGLLIKNKTTFVIGDKGILRTVPKL